MLAFCNANVTDKIKSFAHKIYDSIIKCKLFPSPNTIISRANTVQKLIKPDFDKKMYLVIGLRCTNSCKTVQCSRFEYANAKANVMTEHNTNKIKSSAHKI